MASLDHLSSFGFWFCYNSSDMYFIIGKYNIDITLMSVGEYEAVYLIFYLLHTKNRSVKTRTATKDYFSLSINLLIILSINLLAIWAFFRVK